MKNNRRGFTLIEVIIYSGILAGFFAAILVFMSNILGSVDAVRERNEVVANQEFIERKLDWILHNASQIQIPAVGSTSSELKAVLTDGSTADFVLSGNILNLSAASLPAEPINSLRVNVTNFSVSNTTSSPTQLSITVAVQSVVYTNTISSSTYFYVLPK
jgi:type II secretory pathway pseudopilin PulG